MCDPRCPQCRRIDRFFLVTFWLLSLALALGLIIATFLPVKAQEVPAPVKAEVPARSCYLHGEVYWNSVMAATPLDAPALTNAYRVFAGCARIALITGERLPNGERLPWFVDYYADTKGALLAQTQLIAAEPKRRCAHTSLASALVKQALETLYSRMPDPLVQTEEEQMNALSDTLRARALRCLGRHRA